MPVIQFNEISREFDGKKIIDNLNFKLKENSCLVIMGDSGAGKSTIFNLILRFIKPSSGNIVVNDKPIVEYDLQNLRSSIAWLPQNIESIGSGSTKQTIQYILELADLKLDEKRLLKLADQLNIEETILKKEYNNLSGGEKQRIALISTIMLDRKILLLDEPTSALDAANAKRFIKMINDIEATKLIITHDDQLKEYADEVLEL